MAIEQGLHDDFGKKRKYVSIDLSDTKHKNRVVSFLKCKHPLTGKFYYDVKAKWTSGKYHPSMMLSRAELLELSVALQKMVGSASRPKAKKPTPD